MSTPQLCILKRQWFKSRHSLHTLEKAATWNNDSAEHIYSIWHFFLCTVHVLDATYFSNGKCNYRSFVGHSVRQEDVPGSQDCRRWKIVLRQVALADIPEAVEDFHVPSQVRRGSAEWELGHYCGSLRGPVSIFIL